MAGSKLRVKDTPLMHLGFAQQPSEHLANLLAHQVRSTYLQLAIA